MEYNKNQYDPALPINSDASRQSTDFLPKLFRSDTNNKFLSATVDQLIGQGQVEKINAYIGRKTAKAYESTDNYLEDIDSNRTNYQLEPAVVTKDHTGNVEFYSDFNDYINQLRYFNGNVDDLSLLNSQEYYAWDPKISWDALINFREYFWLPSGPPTVSISGQAVGIISTYSVGMVNDGNSYSYVFSPDGVTRNPSMVLYRGQTYEFDINAVGHPLEFRTSYSLNAEKWTDGVYNGGIDKGKITFTVPYGAPDKLYYGSTTDVDAFGTILIETIDQSSTINVETEILGKKTYTMIGGTSLMNGMKVNFIGAVFPSKYTTGTWYVEGVGDAIVLVPERELMAMGAYTSNELIPFDGEKFDSQGFDSNINYLKTPDYITINRGAVDRNPWSRSNRWFHTSVIEESYRHNGLEIDIDYSARAVRPIIEFNAGYQLWNSGYSAKRAVHLVDDYTTDIFSIIEGATGYNVDGVDLTEGMRLLVTADTDIRVANKIYAVNFVDFNGTRIINLVETDDAIPMDGDSVMIYQGSKYAGSSFHYINGGWNYSQQKTALNQSPLFDVFDENGNSYGDATIYVGTDFAGNRLFSYATGTVYDSILGFPVKYRTFDNTGDLLFNFDLHTSEFKYQTVVQPVTQYASVKLGYGYLKRHANAAVSYENGWTMAYRHSIQPVVKQITIDHDDVNFYILDMYEGSAHLDDLVVSVYLNNKKLKITEYDIYRQDNDAYVEFFIAPKTGDSVIIKTTSSAVKTDVGFYEFPMNFQNNPDNGLVSSFTLGELMDNVKSITNNHPDFYGEFPGTGNLNDLGKTSGYSDKIVQNSGPIPVSLYHINHKTYNVMHAIQHAKNAYSKFKRNLIRTAVEYGYDGETRIHLDLVLKSMTNGMTKTSSFALSDMVPYGPSYVYEQRVIDDSITEYPLAFDFDLSAPSNKSVLVYLNGVQILHGIQYEFVNGNFVNILTPIVAGDELSIVQYDSTDLCYVPETPTKLGLYPLYEPKIYVDTTYQKPTTVIQGHDGSITVAYDDFRDSLLLEFEKRIYNNIKVSYSKEHFNIHDYLGGYFRDTTISKSVFNSVLAQDFLSWNKNIQIDYTNQDFFDLSVNRDESFLYNYGGMSAPDGTPLDGFWRGIYRHVYDTDRPNITPWEMLGFSIKPVWWETSYGPAPYTSSNLILWQDIAGGIIREPGKSIVINPQYARPTVLSHIPVDAAGDLLSPLDSNFANDFNFAYVKNNFKFGDCAPTENAWRRSSEFPFAVLATIVTLRPSKAFAVGFDRTRQIRDLTGQIAYKAGSGMERLGLKNLIVPSNVQSSNRVYTSGLVNYISEYIISKSINMIPTYLEDLTNTTVNIGCKLAGFTNKDKFKLILDSRSPGSKGKVFIPEENYSIALNVSSPVGSSSYSAVIVEKRSDGFYIRGYDNENPVFKYQTVNRSPSDVTINVGGISEPYVEWTSGQFYSKGTIVKYSGSYYKCITTTTSIVFDTKYFEKIAELPIIGGRSVIISKVFSNRVKTLHYGARLLTIQDVADFMLGYGKYLESVGYVFDEYNTDMQVITNWDTSVKEFAFWTTQNWSSGAIISLSPAANKVEIRTKNAVVDNIDDPFYGYDVFKADGTQLEIDLVNFLRVTDNFYIAPANTTEGIYFCKLNMVQKEHVLILDDFTIFNDVIYDHVYGYRQDRIKVVGYRTMGWTGGFDIPGFVYDQVNITDWRSWTDYKLGSVVKHGEFYYIASANVAGDENFQTALWDRLASKPESRLIPNMNSMALQFTGFYDLDTASFDSNQERYAQHLIGYQPRQYLANIINDEVSQYKFYQGMIRDKGTSNVFIKLFDALNSATGDSIELYEEWAIRLGRYGATDIFDELEYIIDERKVVLNPQPFELVTALTSDMNDQVYRILPSDVYIAGSNPSQSPFAIKQDITGYTTGAGFVNLSDVALTVKTFDQILTQSTADVGFGQYLWVGYDGNAWGVYQYNNAQIIGNTIDSDSTTMTLTYDGNIPVSIGDFVGLTTNLVAINAFYKVIDNTMGKLVLSTATKATVTDVDAASMIVGYFKSAKVSSIDDIAVPSPTIGDKLWVDQPDWKVMTYAPNIQQTIIDHYAGSFSKKIAVADTDTVIAIYSDDGIRTMVRNTPLMDYAGSQILYSPITDNGSYGHDMALSRDGKYLAIGAPAANNGGAVLIYLADTSNVFALQHTIVGATAGTTGFASRLVFSEHVLYVVHDAGVVQIDAAVGVIDDSVAIAGILDIDASENGVLIIGTAGTVTVSSGFDVERTYHGVDHLMEGFGKAVAINREGTAIAIGGDVTSDGEYQTGKVVVSGDFVEFYELLNPRVEINGKFGTRIKFGANNDTLAVYASGGDQLYDTTITAVTFDDNSTTFVDTTRDVGVVHRYDSMGNKFVYAESLQASRVIGNDYGSDFAYASVVYVNDYSIDEGSIHMFKPMQKSWSVLRANTGIVDISKIKSVFLYNKKTNEVIKYLDYIDSYQGKIPGIADQELRFKTVYDPAVYSVGNSLVVVDGSSAWSDSNTGRLWWDLSTCKFVNPNQDSILYKANTWNDTFPETSADIYEWVRSPYKPSDWDKLADTEYGMTLGISGKSKYGDVIYSSTTSYDTVSQTNKTVYYFWVKNKVVVPNVTFRSISAFDVSRYINEPMAMGLAYATIMGPNQFALYNCSQYITASDVVLNIRFWTSEVTTSNIHSHYQIIAENDGDAKLNPYIERKWIDSLVGVDESGNFVPDIHLPAKLRYGVLSKPRQTMFVNRIEALKQYVQRVNRTLVGMEITDVYDLSALYLYDAEPAIELGRYDVAIDTFNDIRYLNTAGLDQAIATVTVVDGRITGVTVTSQGNGYIIPPSITINGTGTDGYLQTKLEGGKVTSIEIVHDGYDYVSNTSVTIRPFTVLVKSDETVNGKWSLYTWNATKKNWVRLTSQQYDTRNYWSYADWYLDGYDQYTLINDVADYVYELPSKHAGVGDVIRVNNHGSGGWILLKKTSDVAYNDITLGYITVGRQNGTVQLSASLYDYGNYNIGYDGPLYDASYFDNQPTAELRNIISCIKNSIFVGENSIEYTNLFFASVRYAFSEQSVVDWAFKTSFLKARHNVGSLTQRVTYRNDNLDDYRDYIDEVKPYRTKVREYVSSYEYMESANSTTTDFDFPAAYSETYGIIMPYEIAVSDNGITATDIQTVEPWASAVNNVGHSIVEISVVNGGSGYTSVPDVVIDGLLAGFGTRATAIANISKGAVNSITIISAGSGYLRTPTVEILGGTNGSQAIATARLGKSPIRSLNIGMKFDRYQYMSSMETLNRVEAYTGSGDKTRFVLNWPMSLDTSTVTITVDGTELLIGEYVIGNTQERTGTYNRQLGMVVITPPPADNSAVEISYQVDIDTLSAVDRIQFLYNPANGMIGNDLGQLLVGIDYAGVEISGMEFDYNPGWDSHPWSQMGWDSQTAYDTDLSGGDFATLNGAYSSATGLRPEDIIVDGDGFVTPDTSHAPEELLPGHVLDTVDIRVHEAGIGSAPIMHSVYYYADGVVTDFEIGQPVENNAAIIVSVNGNILPGNAFSIDWDNNSVYIQIGLVVNDVISIRSFSHNGAGLVDIGNFHASGDARYPLSASWNDALSAYVTVDGNPTPVTVYKNGYDVGIEFSNPPVVGMYIEYALFLGSVDTFSDIREQVITGNTTPSVQMQFPARYVDPLASNVLVKSGGKILTASNNYTFTVSGNNRSFVLERYAFNSITSADFTVSVNGKNLTKTLDYTWIPTTNTIKLKRSAVKTGDIVVVAVYVDADYRIDGAVLTLLNDIIADFSIVTYSNHDLLSINRYSEYIDVNTVITTNSVTITVITGDAVEDLIVNTGTVVYIANGETRVITGSVDIEGGDLDIGIGSDLDILGEDDTPVIINTHTDDVYYNRAYGFLGGIIVLDAPISSDRLVIVKNRVIMTPTVDYVLLDNGMTIIFRGDITVVTTDVIEIMRFDGIPVHRPFGYRIFKDILNKNHYTRLDSRHETALASPLLYTDSSIRLVDASGIGMSNNVGYIMIGDEQIKFTGINGDELTGITRGMGGTSVVDEFAVGERVYDMSVNQDVPYADTTLVTKWTSTVDGEYMVPLDFDVSATYNDGWYTSSIPELYHQCNQVEVFVSGTRMRKSPVTVWDSTNGAYSPAADVQIEAEYSVKLEYNQDGTVKTMNAIRLTTPLPVGTQVTVYKKIGKVWTDGERLAESTTDIAKFIKAVEV